jgi:hypothetical protein
LEAVAREVARAFERVGLLQPGTGTTAFADQELDVVGREKLTPRPGLACVNLRIDSAAILPGMSELVYTRTWAEHYEGLDGLTIPEGASPDKFVFPILDVSVYSKTVRATHFDDTLACRSWAMIEFSYEDIRINEEVHRIRDWRHPLFRELRAVWRAEVDWVAVVT